MYILLLLFLWPLLLFMLFGLILLPFQFSVYSLINLFTFPLQLFKIATNPRLRRNHALEHATINVIEQRYGPTGLSGLAQEDGFIIEGHVDPVVLDEAAREGLFRLQQGERQLAIHERCGTSMLAANFLSAVIFILLFWASDWFNFFSVLLALLVGQVLGPLLGRFMQKWVTTSPEVNGFRIAGVEIKGGHGFSLFRLPPARFFIRTIRQL